MSRDDTPSNERTITGGIHAIELNRIPYFHALEVTIGCRCWRLGVSLSNTFQ